MLPSWELLPFDLGLYLLLLVQWLDQNGQKTQRVVNNGDESHDYLVILGILGFFSSSFSRKIHPCLPFPKTRDSSSLASRFCGSAFAVRWILKLLKLWD